MSTCYWIIEGVGINTDKIAPHLDRDKLINFLAQQFPEDDDIAELYSNPRSFSFDIEDFLYGEPFENLADLLTHCDDTDTLTYGDDGEGGYYFYYPPSMPWHMRENEPQTIEEVHKRIISAVQKVTNLTDTEILDIIDDDIYVVGIG